jgi:signal peptidase II
MKIRFKILLFCLLSLVFIGCDQVTKDIAKHKLVEGMYTSYLHDTVRLIYVQNTGAALNLGDSLPPQLSFWLLSIFPLIVLCYLFVYAIRNAKTMEPIKMLSFCLIFAGGIGNIIDRILFDRHVTDFMNIGFGNIRTGIFNFADVCVTSGVIGLLISRFLRRPNEKNRVNTADSLS